MDWSEKNLCIKCDEGGNLLVCSENGCPLAIHEGCMGCPARFDDKGHFYCPYCLYKRAVAEAHQAREYALARKKALLIFMNEDVVGKDKQTAVNDGVEVNGVDETEIGERNVNVTTCGDDKSIRDSDSILDQSIIHLDEEHDVSNAEEEKIPETEASAGSKGQEPSLDMPEEQKMSDEEEAEIHDKEHEASAASSSQEPPLKIQEPETPSTSSGKDLLPLSERAKRASKRRKTTNSESVLVKNNKSVEQGDKNKQTSPFVNSSRRSSRRLSSASGTEEVIKEKSEVPKRLKQPEQPSVKLASDTFGNGKRKRLLWREEEEEMLKAGVEKFSKEPTKNLPWRKILEMGRFVFDGTRTPSDLRSKWKNMSTK